MSLFQNITQYIAIPQNVSTVGHIFKTSMNLTHVFKEEICPVDIYIWCLVGRTSMEIAEKHFTNCTAGKCQIAYLPETITDNFNKYGYPRAVK